MLVNGERMVPPNTAPMLINGQNPAPSLGRNMASRPPSAPPIMSNGAKTPPDVPGPSEPPQRTHFTTSNESANAEMRPLQRKPTWSAKPTTLRPANRPERTLEDLSAR